MIWGKTAPSRAGWRAALLLGRMAPSQDRPGVRPAKRRPPGSATPIDRPSTWRSRISVAGRRCAQLVKHHQGALARRVGARPVVAAEGGGDRQAVGALGVGVQGEGSLGIGPGLIGVAPYESKLAQLQKALELHDPDVLDLVLEPGHGVEIAQRLPAPSHGGGVE